jgi:tetratricopeptide (TPR) repeat protein
MRVGWYITFSLFYLLCLPTKAEDVEISAEAIQRAEEYYRKGKEFIQKGDYQKANQAFKKAGVLLESTRGQNLKRIDLKKRQPPSLKGNLVKVESILDEAKKAFREGDFDKALTLYKQLLETYPKNYNLHYNLGILYLKKLDYARAVDEFEKVIALNKRDFDTYYNLGIIYESFLGDRKKALHYYRQFLKFSPSDIEKEMVKNWIRYLETQD